MDFTALRYFCETAQTHSIRAASERLHVAPSAISRQITKLEHELQAPIFDRLAHGMILTAAGEILQSRVEGMVRELERVKSDIAALQNLQFGTVDIYCFQSAVETFIPVVLHQLYARYPNLSFNVRVSNTTEAIHALVNRAAEVGLLVDPPSRDTISTRELFQDTIVAAVAPHHPLAGSGTVSLRKIAEFPLALIEPSFALRQQVDIAFSRYEIDANIFCVTNSLSLLKHIGRFDRQCVLLPRFIVEEEVLAGTLCSITIEELAETRRGYCMSMLNTRVLSPAAKVFADAVVTFCQRYTVQSRMSLA